MSLYQQVKNSLPILTLAALVACSPKDTKKAAPAKEVEGDTEANSTLVMPSTNQSKVGISVPVTNWSAATAGVKENVDANMGAARTQATTTNGNLDTILSNAEFKEVTEITVDGQKYPIIDCTAENEKARAPWFKDKLSILQQFYTVLIDVAHESPGNMDRMLWCDSLSTNGYNVFSGQSALNKIPQWVDVLLISQVFTPYLFRSSELDGIQRFVERGGSLIILAEDGTPAATQLAAALGVQIVHGQFVSPCILSSEFCMAGQWQKEMPVKKYGFSKEGATPILKDKNGAILGVSFDVGKGRVVCLPNPDNALLVRQLLCGLVGGACKGGKSLSSTQGIQSSFPPDRRVEVGSDIYYFPSPASEHVESAVDAYKKLKLLVMNELLMSPSSNVVTKPFFMACKASGSGGTASPWLPLAGGVDSFGLTAIHEFVHMFSGCLQINFEEAIAYRMSIELGKGLYPTSQGLKSRMANFGYWKGESGKNKSIDLRSVTEPNTDAGYARAWCLIEQWESAFGKDFMPQVVAASRVLKQPGARQTTAELVYIVNMLAKENLGPNASIGGVKIEEWNLKEGLPRGEKPKVSDAKLVEAKNAAKKIKSNGASVAGKPVSGK